MTPSEELALLLRAERAARPPEGLLAQGWERLTHHLAATTPTALSAAAHPLVAGPAAVAKWVLVGFVVGGLGAATTSQFVTSSTEAARDGSAELAVPLRLASPTPSAVASAASSALGAAAASSLSASAAVSPRPPAESTSAPLAFDDELRLIAAANRELDAGRVEVAKASLAEHAERFPRGVFAVDREALMVLAACRGKPDELSLGRFVERFPKSPLRARLERACRGASGGSPGLPSSARDFAEDR